MYVKYVDRRSQLLGIMCCDEGYALLQISCNAFWCYGLDLLSNNLNTPWLISYYGNSMKPENRWAAQDEV